jgi:hypothetical protein
MFHRTAVLGSPGSGKSTAGLSYPGVEHHCFGSSEEDTAMAFTGRDDILPCYKPEWFDCLTETDQAKFTDESANEAQIGQLTKVARAKNIARYRRYLYKLKADLKQDKRPELKTIFLDNFTPFALEFQDYVEVVYGAEFTTKEGNFNSIKFSMKYQQEMSDFLRFFVSLPCHTVMSCHVAMSVDEETAAKADFMKDTQKGIKHQKEWQPLIMGKTKFVFAGIFTWAFFLDTEEQPGQPTRYLAKLEADSSVVGIAKSRIQPFTNPRRLEFPQYKFYETLNSAVEAYRTKGEPVAISR